ncbi:MAG: DUF1801 domain-containing protein [Cyclobacteriaceae bacterium]|nr:DUF1801 domain-containing protein [Cyclobacteriaceae bacterium]
MSALKIKTNPEVEKVFRKYPESARSKIERLRKLIVEAAEELDEITELQETLKWGEPSYITKIGSTIRIDWKDKAPDQYAMYFQCTSSLVSTFKVVYPDRFAFEGNRALVFQMDKKLPEAELKKCIKAGLTYHKVKKLPLLGL